LASHFVGRVKIFEYKELGVALAPTTALNEVRLGEASGKKAVFNLQPNSF
jgi:hypothetical protein